MNKFIKGIKIAINFLMTIIIIIGIIFIGLFLVGIESFVVESGSMEPEIPVYSLVLVNKKANYDEIKPNDIVAFNTEVGSKVIHRVVDISADGVLTKGDANEVPDGVSTTRKNFIGKYVACIPKIGKAIKVIQTKRGKIILGTVVVVLVLAGILIGESDSNTKKYKKAEEK